MWRHGGWVDPTGLLLCATFSACASQGKPHAEGMGGVRDQSVLASRPATATATGTTDRTVADAALSASPTPERPTLADSYDASADERTLREELATAPEPAPAALELADLLCALERHREALAVVDVARQRSEDPALEVCRASLLRDLGQRQPAAAALLELVHGHGAAAVHPGLLFECAELQWLVGDADGAAATLRSLQAVHASDPWCATNRLALDGLAAELASRDAPPRVRIRDLLASLRGNGSVPDRIRLLGELVALADQETGARRQHLRTRALAIACADESPAVRARAVQLADPDAEDAEAFCRAALEDVAPIVRRFAAECAPACAPATATALLLDAMQHEADPAAFVAMHTVLTSLVPNGPTLAPQAENDAAVRQQVALAWRQRCSR